jgi:hypothetical protein
MRLQTSLLKHGEAWFDRSTRAVNAEQFVFLRRRAGKAILFCRTLTPLCVAD